MKLIGLITTCFFLLFGVGSAQEVIITDFPVGVGGSVDRQFFEASYPQLQALVDSLNSRPLAIAIVTGGADGELFKQNSDAKNPALALGRAHALKRLLINHFKVDSTRIIVQSEDRLGKGPKFRYASVRLSRDLSSLASRINALEKRPPVEERIIERIEPATPLPPPPLPDMIVMHLSAGLSSSPFGGIPIVGASIGWQNRLFIEGLLGHTFWNKTFRFEDQDLDTKRRLIGGNLIIFPKESWKVGLVAGWLRTEEISQDFFRYVKISEGLVLGLRAMPFEFISVTAAYNPSRNRQVDKLRSVAKSDQFLISITGHLSFGGNK